MQDDPKWQRKFLDHRDSAMKPTRTPGLRGGDTLVSPHGTDRSTAVDSTIGSNTPSSDMKDDDDATAFFDAVEDDDDATAFYDAVDSDHEEALYAAPTSPDPSPDPTCNMDMGEDIHFFEAFTDPFDMETAHSASLLASTMSPPTVLGCPPTINVRDDSRPLVPYDSTVAYIGASVPMDNATATVLPIFLDATVTDFDGVLVLLDPIRIRWVDTSPRTTTILRFLMQRQVKFKTHSYI